MQCDEFIPAMLTVLNGARSQPPGKLLAARAKAGKREVPRGGASEADARDNQPCPDGASEQEEQQRKWHEYQEQERKYQDYLQQERQWQQSQEQLGGEAV